MTIRKCGLISIGCLLAAGVAAGQGVGSGVGPGVAPVAPAPAPMPAAAAQLGADSMDWNGMVWEAQEKAQGKLAEAQAKVQEKMAEVRQKLALAQEKMPLAAAFQFGQPGPFARFGGGTGDLEYDQGRSCLDQHRWDAALVHFNNAASQKGSHAEGALYWKAYTLNKLGRRDDALAAIAELRKSYASSRWLDDAKALELEVKQANGQAVSPDSQSDEDLKLMALNGLMQSDPERALTALDSLLKSAQPPRLKEQALFVLAQNNSPKAQQMLEQVARGSGNPDLQLKAINYLGVPRIRKGDGQNRPNSGQLLIEIYGASSDVNVKRAVLNAFSADRDGDRLLQISKTEKDAELRRDAIRRLTSLREPSRGDALIGIYGSEQDKEVKRSIASSFASQGNVKQLVAMARGEHDPEMVRYIVGELSRMKSPEAADYLMEILKK